MFGVNDIPKFFLAFFIVLPIISFLHESGHVFFAWVLGGKNIKVVVGTGDVVFRKGMLELRKYYFWYGQCTFDNLKRNRLFSNILIFLGGVLFNAISVLVVIRLIEHNILEPGMLSYQFTYFSLYYIFFALLPMPYPGGNYSDGKIVLDLIRHRKHIDEKTFRIQWDEEKGQWAVLDHNRKLVGAFQVEEEALAKAQEVARENRPSRVFKSKSGEETEVRNFPRIPL